MITGISVATVKNLGSSQKNLRLSCSLSQAGYGPPQVWPATVGYKYKRCCYSVDPVFFVAGFQMSLFALQHIFWLFSLSVS